jgi:putative DNA primase/helicase
VAGPSCYAGVQAMNRLTRPVDYASWPRDRQNVWFAEYQPKVSRALVLADGMEVEKPELKARPPAFSDEALALRFADRHASDLRFVAAWNKWLVWDGSRWRFDDTLQGFNLAREICREAAFECNQPRLANSIASVRTVSAITSLARADRRIAATPDQWDADPWLLNTPGGIVDLRTGEMRLHDQAVYATKITTVAPGGSCDRFLEFLDRITGKDGDLIDYLRRVFGYALTGVTNEHALFFGYGTGANGKSVLLSTISGILGDYHKVAPIETFTATNVDRHPTDLAMLRGARLVTATETEEGRRWAESRIKSLTGGDRVSARFMRQDFFEFIPQFKLVIAGNHKPGLRSVDEAIRRRFHLIPFAVTIPPEERDAELAEKLRGERPGILAGMIEGCLHWQGFVEGERRTEKGLQPPEVVKDATKAYLEGEDAIKAWLDDKCEVNPAAWEASAKLFASWSEWADGAGEAKGSAKRLSQALEARGFQPFRQRPGGRGTNPINGFKGLSLVEVGGE